MKRRVALLTVLATLALIGATNVPAGAGPGSSPAGTTARLQMYTVVADQTGAKAIKAGGYDIASVEQAPGGGVRHAERERVDVEQVDRPVDLDPVAGSQAPAVQTAAHVVRGCRVRT